MDFRDQFIEAGGKPIQYQGREVHLAYRRAVRDGERLRVTIKGAVPRPVQGIRLAAKNCLLAVGAVEGKQFVLWRDTAPDATEFGIRKARRGAEVTMVNVWRDQKHGSALQGLNYSGIEVLETSGGAVLLRCSDGSGPADFEDLVVEVTTLGAVS